MAKSSADDQELRRACEAAIEGTKQTVVMSIRVAKGRGMWGKTHKLGRDMAKPRVLALSGTQLSSFFLSKTCSEKRVRTIVLSEFNCVHWGKFRRETELNLVNF